MNTAAKDQSELERYAALLAEARAIKGVSLGKDAWRRLRKNRVAMGSLAFLVILSLLAVLTPLLPLQPPRYVDTGRQFEGPTFYLPAEPMLKLDGDDQQREASLEEGFGRLDLASRMLLDARVALFGDWSIPSVCGTDLLGRDILSRIFWGARISIAVGLVATLVSLVIGVSYGAIAGYFGGWIDNLMMRIVDVMYSIPFIFVVIFLITILNAEITRQKQLFTLNPQVQTSLKDGPISQQLRRELEKHRISFSDEAVVKKIETEEPGDQWKVSEGKRGYTIKLDNSGNLAVFDEAVERVFGASRIVIFFFVVGAIYWLTMARVVRGQVISLKNEQFVEAARTIGAGRMRIIFLHLVPNLLSVIIVYLTLTIPRVMLFEAFLSFLGLGVEPPDVSWGLLASEGIKAITAVRIFWWLVVFPGLALGLTLWALNFLGDGLRDALDPRLKNQ